MKIVYLKGGQPPPPRKTGDELLARLKKASDEIVAGAKNAEQRQRDLVAGITDAAMRESVEKLRKRLI